MNKKIKYFIYLFCTLTLVFFITACNKKEENKDDIDNNIKINILNISNNLISNINSLDDENLDKSIKELEEGKEFALAVALSNWKVSKEEVGQIKEIVIEDALVSKDKDGFFVILPIKGEKKEATFRLSFDKNLQKINSISIDINYTIMEKLSKAFLNTIIGMSVVFIILIFIIFIISLFKYISIIENKLNAKKDIVKDDKEENNIVVDIKEDLTKDEELVAIISAAIRAYEEENSNSDTDLIVRKLNKRERRRIF